MKYDSFHEILDQSTALKQTLIYVQSREKDIRNFFKAAGDVVFVGCGSSYWASLSAHRTFALYNERRTFAVKAGEILMNPDEYKNAYSNPILVCPSRSGNTSELLKAVTILRDFYGNVPVLSIIEYEDAPLEKLSDLCLNIPWANEISVCQTRSFSCLYLAMVLISAIVSDNSTLLSGMQRYVEAAPMLHKKDEKVISELVSSFQNFDYLVAIGSGRQYGVAVEGAYIGIEMALLNASYYMTLELRHGPIVTVGENTLVAIVSNGKAKELEENMAADSKRQGAKVLAVTADSSFQNADWVFSLDGDYPVEATALYYTYVMQMFAYYQALRKGLDPDHPGDLIPFITL